MQGAKAGSLLPEGSSRFAFRRLSEKQKIQKLCALCVSSEAGGEKKDEPNAGSYWLGLFSLLAGNGRLWKIWVLFGKLQEKKLDILNHNK